MDGYATAGNINHDDEDSRGGGLRAGSRCDGDGAGGGWSARMRMALPRRLLRRTRAPRTYCYLYGYLLERSMKLACRSGEWQPVCTLCAEARTGPSQLE